MAQGKDMSVQGVVLSLMRIVVGLTFGLHGAQKILGLFGGKVVNYMSLAGLAGFLELGGGILLILGLFTRPVAFVLSGEMAYAYFVVHAHRALMPIQNGGELAAVYSFVFLYLSTIGGGPMSLDRILRKK